MENIHYRLTDVLDAHHDLDTNHRAMDLLEQIKANLEAGHRVFVPYPDGRGRWRLQLDPEGSIVWRCHLGLGF